MRNVFALAALLCVTATAAAGTLYRWVDKNGNVHYSDQVPAGTPSKLVTPTLNSGADAVAAEDPAQVQARADKCKKLQDQLTAYTKAGKITETDSIGNQREYTEDEKKKLIQITQGKVDEACGSTASATP